MRNAKFWYRLSAVSAILLVVLVIAGCALPTFLSDASQVIPEVLQSILAVLSLVGALTGGALSTAEIATVTTFGQNAETLLQSIQAMVTEYNSDKSASVLANIEAGVQSWIDNATSFLTSLHITNATVQTEIVDFVTLALTQFKAWATLLPTLSASAGATLTIVVPMTHKQFADNFNAIRTRQTGDAAVNEALAHIKKM